MSESESVDGTTVDALRAIRDWDGWMQARGLADGTRKHYRRAAIRFFADHDGGPESVVLQDLVVFSVQAGGQSHIAYAAMHSLYAYLRASGEVDADPTEDMPWVQPPKKELGRRRRDAQGAR